jgi:hypothetical protein
MKYIFLLGIGVGMASLIVALVQLYDLNKEDKWKHHYYSF